MHNLINLLMNDDIQNVNISFEEGEYYISWKVFTDDGDIKTKHKAGDNLPEILSEIVNDV